MGTFADFLADPPLLHNWSGRWCGGGFKAEMLKAIHRVVDEHADRPPRIIETGAGRSTIMFLHLDVDRLVTVAPDAALRDRIFAYCDEHSIDASRLEFVTGRSELELPRMLLADPDTRFDVALIDGSHAWPTVFVDFCYLNAMLDEHGGLLLLDDLQLHSVAELDRLLAQQPGWHLSNDLGGKLHVWRKEDGAQFFADHAQQPYILAARSPAAQQT